jgi:predicted outer membrane repeat protein
MYTDRGTIDLTDCMFWRNSASSGGAIGAGLDSVEIFVNCEFSKNSARSGGAIYTMGTSAMLLNCTFSGNTAENYGGGIFNHNHSTTLTNCVFSGNLANKGGGMHSGRSDSTTTLTNCVFSGNFAGYAGALNAVYANHTLRNCILSGNVPGQIEFRGTTVIVTDSDIHGDSGQPWFGEGCIDTDPMFVDSGYWDDNGTPSDPSDDFWVDGDYRLQPESPCINTGDGTALPVDSLDLDGDGDTDEPIPIDLDGHARVLCAQVDMGAYEFGIGDFDCNHTVNLFDFADWPMCMTGPGGGPYSQGCEPFDFQFDGAVDLHDHTSFQSVFRGP